MIFIKFVHYDYMISIFYQKCSVKYRSLLVDIESCNMKKLFKMFNKSFL